MGGCVSPLPEEDALEALDADEALDAELADEPLDDQPLLLDV